MVSSPKGLGNKVSALTELYQEIANCQQCELSKYRTMVVPGEGAEDAELVFVGEAPGWHEDQQGRPFVGPAGHFLEELDIKPDPDCPVCGPKGVEKRKALEEQMKKANEAPLPTEIKGEEQAGRRGIVALLLNQGIEMATGFSK